LGRENLRGAALQEEIRGMGFDLMPVDEVTEAPRMTANPSDEIERE
jgi:hypothetical protein